MALVPESLLLLLVLPIVSRRNCSITAGSGRRGSELARSASFWGNQGSKACAIQRPPIGYIFHRVCAHGGRTRKGAISESIVLSIHYWQLNPGLTFLCFQCVIRHNGRNTHQLCVHYGSMVCGVEVGIVLDVT